MNPEVKQLWKDALLSDEFDQAKSFLRTDYGFCCLGVLCEIAVKHGIIEPGELKTEGDEEDPQMSEEYFYGAHDDTSVLPREVREWAGLDSPNPDVVVPSEMLSDNDEESITTDLADCNDSLNLDFHQIAELVDQL